MTEVKCRVSFFINHRQSRFLQTFGVIYTCVCYIPVFFFTAAATLLHHFACFTDRNILTCGNVKWNENTRNHALTAPCHRHTGSETTEIFRGTFSGTWRFSPGFRWPLDPRSSFGSWTQFLPSQTHGGSETISSENLRAPGGCTMCATITHYKPALFGLVMEV